MHWISKKRKHMSQLFTRFKKKQYVHVYMYQWKHKRFSFSKSYSLMVQRQMHSNLITYIYLLSFCSCCHKSVIFSIILNSNMESSVNWAFIKSRKPGKKINYNNRNVSTFSQCVSPTNSTLYKCLIINDYSSLCSNFKYLKQGYRDIF